MPKPTPMNTRDPSATAYENNNPGQQKLPECAGDFELDAALALMRQHTASGSTLIDPKVQQARQLIELRFSSGRGPYR